jgi:GNAT superfamily N-acetyltransferase
MVAPMLDERSAAVGDRRGAESFVLRPARSGDFGWIVYRHGVVYAEEHGWTEAFEALCGRVVVEYLEDHDPEREAVWIAEVDGRRAGCVMCTRKDDYVAQLRLLFVEPWTRGMGIGGLLVEECVGFARAAGYDRIALWTNAVLADARRIYERAGFELELERRYARGEHGWGDDVVGQEWSLSL